MDLHPCRRDKPCGDLMIWNHGERLRKPKALFLPDSWEGPPGLPPRANSPPDRRGASPSMAKDGCRPRLRRPGSAGVGD